MKAKRLAPKQIGVGAVRKLKLHKWSDIKRQTRAERLGKLTGADLLAAVKELGRLSNAYYDRVEKRVPTLHDHVVVAVVSELAATSKETTVDEDVEYAFAYADAVLKEKAKRESKIDGSVAAVAIPGATAMLGAFVVGKKAAEKSQ